MILAVYAIMKTLKWNKTREIINNHTKNTCQLCGISANNVHHIDGNYKNSSLDNAMTVCSSCHGKLHKEMNKLGALCGICHRELIIKQEIIYLEDNFKRTTEYCSKCGVELFSITMKEKS
jgi:hypothetical protein